MGLKTCALALDVNGGVVERMHNAGNDAWYTAAVLATMLSGPPLPEMREAISARLDEAQQLGRKAINGPNTWKQPLILVQPPSSAAAAAIIATGSVPAAIDAGLMISNASALEQVASDSPAQGDATPRDTDEAHAASSPEVLPGRKQAATKVPFGLLERSSPDYLPYQIALIRDKQGREGLDGKRVLDALGRQIGSIEEAVKLALSTEPEHRDAAEPAEQSERAAKLAARARDLESAVRACSVRFAQVQSQLEEANTRQQLRLAFFEHALYAHLDRKPMDKRRAATIEAVLSSTGRQDPNVNILESNASLAHRRQLLSDKVKRWVSVKRGESVGVEPSTPLMGQSDASEAESHAVSAAVSPSPDSSSSIASTETEALNISPNESANLTAAQTSSPSPVTPPVPEIKRANPPAPIEDVEAAPAPAPREPPAETSSTDLPPEIKAKRAAKALADQRRLARKAAEKERGKALRKTSKKLKRVPPYVPLQSGAADADAPSSSKPSKQDTVRHAVARISARDEKLRRQQEREKRKRRSGEVLFKELRESLQAFPRVERAKDADRAAAAVPDKFTH